MLQLVLVRINVCFKLQKWEPMLYTIQHKVRVLKDLIAKKQACRRAPAVYYQISCYCILGEDSCGFTDRVLIIVMSCHLVCFYLSWCSHNGRWLIFQWPVSDNSVCYSFIATLTPDMCEHSHMILFLHVLVY